MDFIHQIAERLRGLRDALDLTLPQMARQCGVAQELLEEYESGTKDIPVSFLHRVAAEYGVELPVLMFGNEPRMNSYFITRAGKGMKVERTGAYRYQDLAAGFIHRQMSPFMVTVHPSDAPGPLTLNTHEGQEMNFVVEGELEITVDGHTATLHPGDTIMFDARRPHGLRAVGSTVRMLAIIS